MDDVKRCVQDTVKAFGGIDIIIANAGWTRFSDFADLDSMSDEEWNRCWNAQVMGPKKCVQEALPHFKKNEEGGCVIITSSIAGQSLGGSSMPYSVTKAAQVHLMKCIARTQGPKLRINAVLPGLLLTDWGNLYGEERIKTLNEAAALKHEVSDRFVSAKVSHYVNRLTTYTQTYLDDCADMYVTIAKNTSITGQDFIVGEYSPVD